MFKSVEEAFEWMVSFLNLERTPDSTSKSYRLDKMKILLGLFENPQDSFKAVHVAGSKGKGSTCSFIGSILTSQGYKTGIYSSPHLLNYRERITNNHTFFKDSVYLDAISHIKSIVEKLDYKELPGGAPTTFELMTIASFIIFKNEKCDWAVIETGLGGRLDATNVIYPEVSVITPIELEHTEILGDTLEKIAGEKAGIIKEKTPIVTSNSDTGVVEVIKTVAKSKNSEFYTIGENFLSEVTKEGTFLIESNITYPLGIQGFVQPQNALLAIKAVNIAAPEITSQIIIEGLKKAYIPGRFQAIERNPVIVLDGAHTKNSVKGTVETFKKIYGEGTVIFGVIKNKDIESMSRIISENFKNIIISTPGYFKESDINSIVKAFDKIGAKVLVEEVPKDALSRAIKINKPILVTGSFYMAGEIGKLV